MTIIEMAQKCQLIGMRPHLYGIYQEALEKFAALVAAQERQECAKVCDDYDVAEDVNTCDTAEGIAIAIRARGTT